MKGKGVRINKKEELKHETCRRPWP